MNTHINRNHKKIIFSLFLFILSFNLCGCFGKPKNFSSDDLTITLTVDFNERKSKDFNLYLSCDDVVFTAKKETASDLEAIGYEVSSLKGYCHELLSLNNQPTSSLIQKNDYYYFVNSEVSGGAKYTYVHFMFEHNKVYWVCNFVCKSKDYSRIEKYIFQWADTITFKD